MYPLLVVLDNHEDEQGVDTANVASTTTITMVAGESPQFQQGLARLMESKQRRHKAVERDVEEIEAEFSSPLTARAK
ncbi:hypothetical protein IV203_025480 [Nitzschia inconspicua]|uniref:Uncharacterized protein n=1 Tax=Nitzschia inconspicua TaxID=303405 RepID=A0A9K3K9R1_9STRA|nr:hypothetical protein IV203_028260 [Nitzschia inconspicua]KAG7362596.1 hypothetical protein IV203_025480 [Nitzschia inconspicua]